MNFSELDLLVFVEEFFARVHQGLSMDVCVCGGGPCQILAAGLFWYQRMNLRPSMVAHTFNFSIQETEAGGSMGTLVAYYLRQINI